MKNLQLLFIFLLLFVQSSFAEVSSLVVSEKQKVNSKKGKYLLLTKSNPQGEKIQQNIIGKEYSEILLDENQDGVIDTWQIRKGETQIYATKPINGFFTSIETIKRTPKGVLRAEYFYSTLAKKYHLFNVQILPYKLLAMDNFEVINSCSKEDAIKALSSDYHKIFEIINNKGLLEDSESLYKLMVNDRRDFIFDPSCIDPKKKKLNNTGLAASQALLSILKSGVDSSAKNYLACMTQNNMGIYAARIEGNIYRAIEHGPKEPNSSRLISCRESQNSSTKATYDMKTESINIEKNPTQLGNLSFNSESFSSDPAPDFSSVKQKQQKAMEKALFHELIHSAGLESEKLVEAVTDCCGNPAEGGASSCGFMRDLIQKELNYRASLGVALFTQDGVNGYIKLKKGFDSEEEAEKAFKAYAAEMAEAQSKAQAALEACTTSRVICDKDFRDAVEVPAENFKKRCLGGDFRLSSSTENNKESFCGDMANLFRADALNDARKKLLLKFINGGNPVFGRPGGVILEIGPPAMSCPSRTGRHFFNLLIPEAHALGNGAVCDDNDTAINPPGVFGRVIGNDPPENKPAAPAMSGNQSQKEVQQGGVSSPTSASDVTQSTTSNQGNHRFESPVFEGSAENVTVNYADNVGGELGVSSNRTDVASRVDRGSALVDAFDRSLTSVGEAFIPRAIASVSQPEVLMPKSIQAKSLEILHRVRPSEKVESKLGISSTIEAPTSIDSTKSKTDEKFSTRSDQPALKHSSSEAKSSSSASAAESHLSSGVSQTPNGRNLGEAIRKTSSVQLTGEGEIQSLDKFITGDANLVEQRLKNAEFLKTLIRNRIQIINKETLSFGSNKPERVYQFLHPRNEFRLVKGAKK